MIIYGVVLKRDCSTLIGQSVHTIMSSGYPVFGLLAATRGTLPKDGYRGRQEGVGPVGGGGGGVTRPKLGYRL